MKYGLIDLYAVMRRRRTTIQEWLDHYGITSIKDFEEKAKIIAETGGYFISDEMMLDAKLCLKVKSQQNFMAVAAASPNPAELIVKKSQPQMAAVHREDISTATKKKKTTKEIGSNCPSDDVKLHIADPEIINPDHKENLDENKNSQS